MASAVSDTGENGTVSDDSEGDMDDSSVGREYNIQTNNGFSVLAEGQMRDSTVPRSKRKRTNTGSVDEETFQTLSNDQKLGIIFQKLINIEEKQSTIGKLEKSIEATDNNVSSIKSTIDGHSNAITLLTYKSLDLEACSRRKNLLFRGLCENTQEDCYLVVCDFLSNELDLNPDFICIDRAHRIGKRYARGISRRPIIVAFRDYYDTVRIMERANMLRNTRFGIDRDYPAEISKARKLLWNRYKELKASSQNPSDVVLEYPARLVVGKTVVDDAFPEWFKVLKGTRLEPSISAISANKRAEARRRNQQLQFSRQVNAAETADIDNGDTGVSERGTHNDTDETDDSADAAFYSGYVSDRMRPQNQVAWGNGKPSNISDESVTHTVSMTDYPPLNSNRQKWPGTSTQRDPPGLGNMKSTTNTGGSRADSSLSKPGRSVEFNVGEFVGQAPNGNQQVAGNPETGGHHGLRLAADKSGNVGREVTGNGSRPKGANDASETYRRE